jgi:hypothetical protein
MDDYFEMIEEDIKDKRKKDKIVYFIIKYKN